MTETKICKNCQQNFIIEPDDFGFYEKIGVSAPTFCPDCRFQRRLMLRNERTYYKRQCDLCKKNIIAAYPASAVYPVYCVKCWWSDNWDPTSYGRDFDFNRPFFEQFKELLDTTPAMAMVNDDGVASVNSEYSWDGSYNKNCYMAICGWHNENALYYFHVDYSKDILDCNTCDRNELLYQCVLTFDSYGCKYCTRCYDCRDCALSFDLKGCSDCAMSIGLRNKQYYILNQPYTKEEYQRKLRELRLDTRTGLRSAMRQFEAFKLKFPHKYAHIIRSVGTTGDVLTDCKNAKNCFFGGGLENCRYIIENDTGKELFDCNHTGKGELVYESLVPDETYNNISTVFCWRSRHTFYSQFCFGVENCIGGSSLKKGQYMIFNKPYTKEEYEPIKSRIVEHMKKTGEWGEFFPASICPYAYNETAAQEWFPLTKEQAIARGYRWKDSEARNYQVTLRHDELPDTIDQVDDSILQQVISCEHAGSCNHQCSTAFRIILPELQLYRRFKVPLPTLCGNCRHYERALRRNPAKLWHRKCMKEGCPNEFETSYAPERPEIVYCETCYNAEVV